MFRSALTQATCGHSGLTAERLETASTRVALTPPWNFPWRFRCSSPTTNPPIRMRPGSPSAT